MHYTGNVELRTYLYYNIAIIIDKAVYIHIHVHRKEVDLGLYINMSTILAYTHPKIKPT